MHLAPQTVPGVRGGLDDDGCAEHPSFFAQVSDPVTPVRNPRIKHFFIHQRRPVRFSTEDQHPIICGGVLDEDEWAVVGIPKLVQARVGNDSRQLAAQRLLFAKKT